MTCNGKGIIGSTLRSSYCPTVVCSNCKGSGKEKGMSDIEDAEIVRCGPKAVKRYEPNQYTNLIEGLEKNCVKGKETVTFSQTDWDGTKAVIKQVEAKMSEMSMLTHVTGAHGLCKATACQWDVLSKMRDKAAKDANKLDQLYLITDHVLTIIDNLVENKVLAASEWWTEKAGQIRSKIDDMKRM
jgi:hypothetical protein